MQTPATAAEPPAGRALAGAERGRTEAIVGGDLSGAVLHTDAAAADRAARSGGRWPSRAARSARRTAPGSWPRCGFSTRAWPGRCRGEATADLTNPPPGGTVELDYAADPGLATRQAILAELFVEPGVTQVTFEGVTYTRADLP